MPSAEARARFEDGTAALIRNRLGKGTAYLSAIALDDITIRNEVNRDYEAQRFCVNEFEPGGDVWELILRTWYESCAELRCGWLRQVGWRDARAAHDLLSRRPAGAAIVAEALERCGYEFDSSFTAGDVLSNFPYALPHGLGMTENTLFYEFPVTMADEEAPGLPGHIEKDLGCDRGQRPLSGLNVC